MAVDHLFPFGGDNAIQNVVFALEWNEQLTTAELRAIAALREDPKHTVLRKTFPMVQEPKMMTININADAGGPPLASNANELGAINFVRPHLTNIGTASRALNISRANCLAVVSEYTRWSKIWSEVKEWIEAVAPAILGRRAIISVGLQYTDLFQWKADPATMVLSEIFSSNSKYLPRNAFQASSQWHSHHGYFEKRAGPQAHDLLENINVNSIENNGQRALQVVTSHRATLRSPIWQSPDLNAALNVLMPDLHSRNKAIMKDLLMPEVQKSIKLDAPD